MRRGRNDRLIIEVSPLSSKSSAYSIEQEKKNCESTTDIEKTIAVSKRKFI